MTSALTLWVVIAAVGGLTYLSRLSFIALFARVEMPALVRRALRFVPAAMLTAIVVPAVALRGGDGDPALAHAKLAAALVASVVAWRTKSPAATMVAGMAALWLTQWLLPRRPEFHGRIGYHLPFASPRDIRMRFEGTDTYVATPDLMLAVNAAIALERPLLIKGEPGTGKTMLAEEVARALSRPLLQWHIKSTTKAQQGLYEYDAVSRLRDSQLGVEKVADIANYIKRGVLWDAFEAETSAVVLIDEVDKADIEFPNDLLRELDRMEFYVYETQRTVQARHRPLVVITSNNEKELPDAFLRRCFFHYIKFPGQARR